MYVFATRSDQPYLDLFRASGTYLPVFYSALHSDFCAHSMASSSLEGAFLSISAIVWYERAMELESFFSLFSFSLNRSSCSKESVNK